jgi:hypothetical protein
MIRETVYTGIGAAALAIDFVTSPSRQQSWLKKAERRGGKLALSGQRQVRPYQHRLESVIEDVRRSTLGAIGLAEENAEKAATSTRQTARRTVASARRSTPRVKVSSRRTSVRRAGTSRQVRRTSISMQTPTSQAG